MQQQQLQLLTQIVMGLMAFFAGLVTLLNQLPEFVPEKLPGDASTTKAIVSPLYSTGEKYPHLMVTGDGTVYINNVSLDLDMPLVHSSIPDFPDNGRPEYLDDGRSVTRYDYRNARYYFQGDKLVRIATPQTPDQLKNGDDISQAFTLYGKPAHCYWSSTGASFCGFTASREHGTAWITQYNPENRKIEGIWLADNLAQLKEDGRKARMEREASAKSGK